MTSGKTHFIGLMLLSLVSIRAYSQQSTFGVDVGEVSDKFGALSSTNAAQVNINGQVTILKGNPKEQRPAIVAGGEIILPADTNNHAKEFAVWGGPMFHAGHFILGFEAQIRKIIEPTAFVDNQFFQRDTLEFLEVPGVIRYDFGASKRVFVEVKGAPEFHPRFRTPKGTTVLLPNPHLDYGYFIRGSAGYNSSHHWYARASYELRYLKYEPDAGNPNGLYNWRSNSISGGVGVTF